MSANRVAGWKWCIWVVGVAGLGAASSVIHRGVGQEARVRADSVPASVEAKTKYQIFQEYTSLPLSFEANQGQAPSGVRFLSRGGGYTLYLTSRGALLTLRAAGPRPIVKHPGQAVSSSPPVRLTFSFPGSNPMPQVIGIEELSSKSHYFIGRDPAAWHRNVPNYAQVRYVHLYAGVDLVYHGHRRQLEYDFVVGPQADPKRIVVEIAGAQQVRTDRMGNLVVGTMSGSVMVRKPMAYQQVTGNKQRRVAVCYIVKERQAACRRRNPHQRLGSETHAAAHPEARTVSSLKLFDVRFHVAHYDRRRPLIIDPVLSYSSYLGGLKDESGNAIAVDSAGAAYVVGQTLSSANDNPPFPTSNPEQPSCASCSAGAPDAFVTKISPDGTKLVYSTYLGGSSADAANAVAVDSVGNAYVAGTTYSTNFPTTAGAFQSTPIGAPVFPDAFVTKLNAAGSALVYSTYLGGSFEDDAFGIAVDSAANCSPAGSCAAYVTGRTASANFPLKNPYQATLGGGSGFDAFVTKLDPTGASEVYSTYLGGSAEDDGFAIAVDGSGNAYVTGQTQSNNFPTNKAYQAAFAGASDAFVSKLSFSSSTLTLAYSTYLGGSGADVGFGIALGSAGDAYVTGQTQSNNFPLTNALQNTFGGGGSDAFVTHLKADGSGLLYSTYLGGNGSDTGASIAVDANQKAHVAGFTTSSNFPTANAVQTTYKNNQDAFVSRLTPSGCSLIFSTFLGGSAKDGASGIAVDAAGNSYVVGTTFSNDFPTQSPFQATTGGGNDAFVAKMTAFTAPAACLSASNLTFSPQNDTTTSAAQTVTLTNDGDAALSITSIVATGDFAETNTCPSGSNTLAPATNCTISVTFSPTSAGPRAGSLTITDNAANSPQVVSLNGTGNDFGLTLSPASATINPGQSATFTLTLTPSPNFTSTVSLACSGQPPDGSCSLSVPSITPSGGNPVTATVTVTTQAPSVVFPGRSRRNGPRFVSPVMVVGWELLALLAVLLAARWRVFAAPAVRLVLSLVILMLPVLVWSGCGTGGGSSEPSSTPPGTYQIKVTATAGTLTHTVSAALTVQ